MSLKILLEKYIKASVRKTLEEEEKQQQRAEKATYLIYRFPGLKKIMEELMSPSFSHFINDVTIVSPKPTTFRVSLINGQDFSISYLGSKKFNVKVSGKKYYENNLGEMERASQAISDLLELNYAPREEAGGTNIPKEKTPALPSGGGSGGGNINPENNLKDQELAADLSAANAPNQGTTVQPQPG